MRTVEIHKSDKFDNMIEEMGNRKEMEACLGYLCLWAFDNDRYCKFVVLCDNDGCIDCTYRDKDGNITYSMFGHMNPNTGSYSTHS